MPRGCWKWHDCCLHRRLPPASIAWQAPMLDTALRVVIGDSVPLGLTSGHIAALNGGEFVDHRLAGQEMRPHRGGASCQGGDSDD
jgi:hypothetical protein